MTDLAINMAPVLGVAGRTIFLAFKAMVIMILGAWAIFWARAIYRTVFKK